MVCNLGLTGNLFGGVNRVRIFIKDVRVVQPKKFRNPCFKGTVDPQ